MPRGGTWSHGRGRNKEQARINSAQAYETLKAPEGGTKGPVDPKTDPDSMSMVFGRDKLTPKKP
jgi:hypothetical protein